MKKIRDLKSRTLIALVKIFIKNKNGGLFASELCGKLLDYKISAKSPRTISSYLKNNNWFYYSREGRPLNFFFRMKPESYEKLCEELKTYNFLNLGYTELASNLERILGSPYN